MDKLNRKEMNKILKEIYQQLLFSYESYRLKKYSYYLPSQNLIVKARFTKTGKIKEIRIKEV